MPFNKAVLERNLALAMSAIALVYKEMPLGAINRVDDFLAMGHIEAFASLDILEEMRDHYFKGDYTFYLDALTSGALRAGKCGEMATLAEFKLKEILKSGKYPEIPDTPLPSIETIILKDHGMVLIGRNPDSDPNDFLTWGSSAVVCDPWARTFYPLDNFQLVKTKGKKITIVDQVSVEGDLISTQEDDYLEGTPKLSP